MRPEGGGRLFYVRRTDYLCIGAFRGGLVKVAALLEREGQKSPESALRGKAKVPNFRRSHKYPRRSASRPRRRRASGLVDSGRPACLTTRARSAPVEREGFTDSRRLCRRTPIAHARERFGRLRRQPHDERIEPPSVESALNPPTMDRWSASQCTSPSALKYRTSIGICGTRNKDEKKGEKLSSLMSWASG